MLAQAQYDGASAVAPSLDGFLSSVMKRLQATYETLGETNSDLGVLSERIFGPEEVPQSGNQSPPTPPGVLNAIFGALDVLQQRASLSACLARGLNSRI